MGSEQTTPLKPPTHQNKPQIHSPPPPPPPVQYYSVETAVTTEPRFHTILGEVPLNNITVRENKKKVKTVKDVGSKEVDEWTDEVIEIGRMRENPQHHVQSQNQLPMIGVVAGMVGKESSLGERRCETQREKKSRVSKML